MRRDQLIALAKEIGAMHALDPALVCAVVEQESSWIPWALRYEEGFYQRYIVPLAIRDATEARGRAFSWGLMQVMGQVAREHAFMGMLPQICDPMIGLEIGATVLSYKLTLAKRDVTRALELWNGGGNPNYPAEVLARVHNYT